MHSVYLKTIIHSGEGSLNKLAGYHGQRILIICDRFLVENGSVRRLKGLLDCSNEIQIFSEVEPDTPITAVSRGLALFSRFYPEMVIAYGGGSAIDTAKGVIYFAKQLKCGQKPKLIAIPTTSGTGSEVTSVTVVADMQNKSKQVIADDYLFPDEAILDADQTISIPPQITANTGMDVLTHALEAYVATNANVYTDALAQKAVELVTDSLLTCYNNGNNKAARTQMHEASTLSGMAFNLAGLGIAHSIAHQLGGILKIPHGLANAIMLKEVVLFNSNLQAVCVKYAKLACRTGLANNSDTELAAVGNLVQYIDLLKKNMKMPATLNEYGIDASTFNSSIEQIIENTLQDRCTATNPRAISGDDIKELLKKVF